MEWHTALGYVLGAFGALFLLIFLLQGSRVRKDRIRSDKAALEAAAVKRFEEIFQISPHASRGDVVAKIKTVITGLGLMLIRHPNQYEETRQLRLEAIKIAERFGYQLEFPYRRLREQRKQSRRQTGSAEAADTAA